MSRKYKNIIPVMHCFNENYVIPAAVSFYSMLINAKKENFYKLYVCHNDITKNSQTKLIKLVQQFPNASLNFVDLTNKLDDFEKYYKVYAYFTKEMYYKLLLCRLFPQHDYMFITDVDVVFLHDFSACLKYINLSDEKKYIYGVKPFQPDKSWLADYYKNYDNKQWANFSRDTVSAGFLVMNLKSMRRNNIEKRFLKFLKEYYAELIQPEQDVINFSLHEENINCLPLRYMVCSYLFNLFEDKSLLSCDKSYSKNQIIKALSCPVQLHFATGEKPWNNPNCSLSEIWYAYLAKTDFFKDFIKAKYNKEFGKVSIQSSLFKKTIDKLENIYHNLNFNK